MSTLDQGATVGRSGGPLRGIVGLCSSVWFGIVLMVLIFIYCTIMSAGLLYPNGFDVSIHWLGGVVPYVKLFRWQYIQPRILFDLTDMEAFSWWPFKLMLALFSLTMIVVTLRKIRLSVVNLGVWMIHTGILVLVGGSVYYFATKVEGDTPVLRRQIEITVPGQPDLVRLPVTPNNQVSAGGYRFRIQSTNPDYSLLTGKDAGRKTYAVTVAITTPTQTFARQLLAGYPQYTEDVIPGKGRAVKTIGRRLVDEELKMRLAFLPQGFFFVMHTGALYARKIPTSGRVPDWSQHPLRGLPHYRDHVGDRSWIWQAPGEAPLPIRPLDIPVAAPESGGPLEGLDVRITGYLRYAPEMQNRFRPDGRAVYPVIGLTLHGDEGQSWTYDLEAFNPRRSRDENRLVEFRWVDTVAALERIERGAPATLHIEVPAQGIKIDAPITQTASRDPDLPFTPLEGSVYSYRVRGVANHLVVDRGRFAGRPVSVAMVEIRAPGRTWERWVSDVPDATRDVSGAHQEIEFDSNIVMRYAPTGRQTPITVVAGPDEIGLHVFLDTDESPGAHRRLDVGRRVELTSDLAIEADYFYPRARADTRPLVAPVHERRENAGATFSRIRVEMRKGKWSRVFWLPYNAYALPDRSYAYPGRLSYQPRFVELPDGRRLELLFSRQRRFLDTRVALDTFELPTHTGGYTGQAITVRDYVSRVRFNDGDRWSELRTVRNNHPTEHKGWWYFQATWDPPGRQGQGGMNYTGLGVGNRNGVYIQLAGTAIAVCGMIYAFYVKPIIKRRRREAVWTLAGKRWASSGADSARPEAVEPEVVAVSWVELNR